MVTNEDSLSSIRSYEDNDRKEGYKGLRIFDYEGLSLRQRENLEGLWKDRKAMLHKSKLHMSDVSECEIDLCGDDENNIQAAICLQALYRRANDLYNRFLKDKYLSENLIILSQTFRYFNGHEEELSENTQKLCQTIEREYSLPKPEYLLLIEELSRISVDMNNLTS